MNIVFKISDNLKEQVKLYYQDRYVSNPPLYSVFQARDYDCIITLYESGKIMFQGLGADIEASYWIEQERIKNNRIIDTSKKEKGKKSNDSILFNCSTIGSDEVGTGDFFGPIVVTSTYVSKENIPFLINLGVRDSKTIPDERIKKIAPEIVKKIPYTSYILNNSDYNAEWNSGLNMNKIKAILHNKVLCKMKDLTPDYDKIVVDQFVYPDKYYEYLSEVKDIVTDITFTIKGEEKCLSVAAASVISRYIFLKEMKKLSDELNMEIPKGASLLVDEAGRKIVQQYGIEKLSEIAKLNFKNTSKIKNSI